MTEQATIETDVTAPEAVAPEAAANEGASAPDASGDETLLGKAEDTAANAGQADKADDEGGKEDNTDSQPLKVDVPEEFSDFAGDFEQYGKDMQAWLTENPDATPQQALQQAAVRQAQAVKAMQDEASKQHVSQVEAWATEARSDSEIGGDKFDENLATATKAIEAFGDDDLRSLLNESGLGNHPAFIRAFYKMGKRLADAPVVNGNPMAADYDAMLDARYPKTSG